MSSGSGAPKGRSVPPDSVLEGWVQRFMKAARGGAPVLRTMLTAGVELEVAFGSTRESASGATIVSEWLAGRFATAQHFEVVSHATRGARVLAQLTLGGDPAFPATWHLEAAVTAEGCATEIALRTQGSA